MKFENSKCIENYLENFPRPLRNSSLANVIADIKYTYDTYTHTAYTYADRYQTSRFDSKSEFVHVHAFDVIEITLNRKHIRPCVLIDDKKCRRRNARVLPKTIDRQMGLKTEESGEAKIFGIYNNLLLTIND